MAWKGICSPRCRTAKSDKSKCKCRCHGQHHGEGNLLVPIIDPQGTWRNSIEEMKQPADYKTVRPRCGRCGEVLIFNKEKGWVHQDGEVYKKRPDGTDDHCVLPQFRGLSKRNQ